MELKINRYNFDVTNEDWILDNGACYQCMTLTHKTLNLHHISDMPTIMSKKQFMELKKENLLIDDTETFKQLYPHRFGCWEGLKIWRFDIKNDNKQKEDSIKLKTEDNELRQIKRLEEAKERLEEEKLIYQYAYSEIFDLYIQKLGLYNASDIQHLWEIFIINARDKIEKEKIRQKDKENIYLDSLLDKNTKLW